jgi:hypothetical protein
MARMLAVALSIGFLISSVAVAPGLASEPALSLGEMARWMVVTDEDAIPSERYAAEEFRALFKSATGVDLATGPAPGKEGSIFVGSGKAMRAHALGFGVGDLGEEGLRIRIGRNALVIAGGRPRGTLYGVYEFYERYLGVRFLTSDHTCIPEGSAGILVPLVDYRYVPPFSFRWSYYGENRKDPAFAARLRNNTVTPDEHLGGVTSQELISHSLSKYLPVPMYGESHPEYYALVNGVRKLDVKGGGPQICVTNPQVAEIVADAINKELDANPERRNVSVSQMDNSEFCQCPQCLAFAEREGSQMGPHMAFVNAVAERVEKKHPGVMVGTLAYDYTRKPPETVCARDNVQIQLCSIECCTLHSLNDPSCPRNRDFCADLARWKEKCKNIWIWHYNTNFRCYDLPFPNFGGIAKNIQLFVDNHVRGVFMQAAGNGMSCEMSDLRNYVMSRCLWHPARESWELVEEFCRLHYCESAGPILEYLRFIHHNAEIRGVHPRCFPTEGEVGLDAAVARQAQDYFSEALRLAKSDEVRKRVEKASMPALKARITTAPCVCENGLFRLDTSALGADAVDRYVELNRRFGMVTTAEETPVKEYQAELDKLRNGVPAVTLENQVWRVVLLPEQNGRIVELKYKKTGRNLVEAPTRSFARWHSHEEWTQGGRPLGSTPTAFACESDGRTAALSMVQPDGSELRRTISLASDTAEKVSFKTELTVGEPQVGLEFQVHPEYDTVTSSEDPNIISVYVKDPDWVHVNGGWDVHRTPDKTCRHAGGGAFAYYHHGENFGVVQTFNPASFAKQAIFWSPARKQVNLQMFTPVMTLAKGQKLAFGYEVGYLSEPPVEAQRGAAP